MTRRPRVLLVTYGLGRGSGAEAVCARHVEHLSGQFEFVVVASEMDPKLARHVRWIPVSAPRRPFLLRFVVFAIRAAHASRNISADLIHLNGPLALMRADVLSCHYLFASTPLFEPGARWSSKHSLGVGRLLARCLERFSYSRRVTRRVAAVSTGGAHEIRRRYPHAPPISVVTNGVNQTSCAGADEERDAMRNRLAVVNDFVLLFTANDWERKGLAIAIEALAVSVKAGYKQVRLVVAGNGDTERYSRLAAQLGVSEKVRFCGAIETIGKYYAAADAFVLPSYYEMFSLAMLEAAAAGLPLIVTAVNGTQELVEGLQPLSRPVDCDATSVARRIQALYDDPLARLAIGSALRERASTFSWAASSTQLASLYSRLLAQDGRGEVHQSFKPPVSTFPWTR